MSSSSLPFKLMDAEDEMQMMRSDAVKQSLVYEVQGKRTISYKGLKHLYPKWLDGGGLSSKIVIEHTYCRLEKDGEEQSTWRWRAQTMIRTECPATETTPARYFETVGLGEKGYLGDTGYNAFGQRTASSIAMRNALRAQIPELEIDKMINNVDNKDLQILETTQPQQQQQQPKPAQVTERQQAPPSPTPPSAPTQTKQEPPAKLQGDGNTRVCSICKLTITARTVEWQGQRKLQWQNPNGRPHYLPPRTGADGKPIFECRPFEEKPQPETAQAAPTPPSSTTTTADPNIKWCECMESKPRWETSPQDGKHHCYSCDLPVTQEQCDVLLKNGGKK